MAQLVGGTFTMSVPGWANGKDGNTGIDIAIVNSNGVVVATFKRNAEPEWSIGPNGSYSDGIKLGTNPASLDKSLLMNAIVKVTKYPSGRDQVTFFLDFDLSFDDASKIKLSSVTDGHQEGVFRMLDDGNQTTSKRFFGHS